MNSVKYPSACSILLSRIPIKRFQVVAFSGTQFYFKLTIRVNKVFLYYLRFPPGQILILYAEAIFMY